MKFLSEDGMGWKQTGLRTIVCLFHGSDTKILGFPWSPVDMWLAVEELGGYVTSYIHQFTACVPQLQLLPILMDCTGHEKESKCEEGSNVIEKMLSEIEYVCTWISSLDAI